MFDDDYTETVTVTPSAGGYKFTVNFRGVPTPYGKVFGTEQEALAAGRQLLANMKASYQQTLTSTRR
jgi:hypothetical protein